MLLILLILAAPALIRTLAVSVGKGPTGGMGFLGTFLGSLGVATLIGLASFIAFFATCFVVCLGSISLSDMGRRGGGGEWKKAWNW